MLNGSSHLAVVVNMTIHSMFPHILITNINIISSYSKIIWLQNTVISKHVSHFKKHQYANIQIYEMHKFSTNSFQNYSWLQHGAHYTGSHTLGFRDTFKMLLCNNETQLLQGVVAPLL